MYSKEGYKKNQVLTFKNQAVMTKDKVIEAVHEYFEAERMSRTALTSTLTDMVKSNGGEIALSYESGSGASSCIIDKIYYDDDQESLLICQKGDDEGVDEVYFDIDTLYGIYRELVDK